MKKLLFTAFLSLMVLGVYAQKKTLKSAQKELKKENYDGALELAKAASTDAETKDNPEVYLVMGKAYMYKFGKGGSRDLATAKQAFDAFKMTMDKGDDRMKEKVMDDVILNPETGDRLAGGEAMSYLEALILDQANKEFDQDKYKEAYGYYDLATQIAENIDYEFYAGYSAQNAQMDDEALKHLLKVANSEDEYPNKKFAYNGVIDIYNRRENWDETLKYVAKAKELYPDEKIYGEYEIDVLINADRMDEAIKGLKDVIGQGGGNANMYYTLAFLQFNNEEFEDALASAGEVLKLEPDHYDALYVVGSIHYNNAVEILKVANNEDDNAKFEAKKKEALDLFKVAQPYFERAIKINPEDLYTLRPMSTIYDQLNMDKERDEILNKIEALEGGE